MKNSIQFPRLLVASLLACALLMAERAGAYDYPRVPVTICGLCGYRPPAPRPYNPPTMRYNNVSMGPSTWSPSTSTPAPAPARLNPEMLRCTSSCQTANGSCMGKSTSDAAIQECALTFTRCESGCAGTLAEWIR